jgi:hypothetical protein
VVLPVRRCFRQFFQPDKCRDGDDADLEDIPDYEEMEEVAEPRGPHADFYDHE